MKDQGTAIIYVSHRLDEVVALADRCTVLRDGRVAALGRRGAFNVADLVQAMTGRAARATDRRAARPATCCSKTPTSRADAISLRAGEVIGLAGLLGSGTTQVLQRLLRSGGGTDQRGAVNGRPGGSHNPIAAIAAGIGFVPGARRLGLVMNQSVRDNILLPSLDRHGAGWRGRPRRATGWSPN